MIKHLSRFATQLLIIAAACLGLNAAAADPMATDFSWQLCQGSARPYPAPSKAIEYPDSLTPVMINHVGRHGARFPASAKYTTTLLEALDEAQKAGTITRAGRDLQSIARSVVELSSGRWGALDSLGMAEQRGIASRMFAEFPMLFGSNSVDAISSYSPRCIMSMYEFTHQLARLDNKVELTTSSGRRYSSVMRFFDVNADYRAFRESDTLKAAIDEYFAANVPLEPLHRVLGKDFPLTDRAKAIDIAMAEYSVLAGLAAIEMHTDIARFLTPAEQNALWGAYNFRQYLRYSASTLASIPAEMASPLLMDIINTTDDFIAGRDKSTVHLRFGHAETLMPLLSLIHLPGAYYLTNYFDTVGKHWQDFNLVPMAANLRLVLFTSQSGEYYLRVDLNEVPTTLIPADDRIYIPWQKARAYLERCIPLYY